MQFQDYDDRSRVDVAKEEAIRFIKKREYDALGLVIFWKRCSFPLSYYP